MPTFSEFAAEHDITMSSQPLTGGALARRQREWGGIPATHTKCSLQHGSKRMTTVYSHGADIPVASVEQVLKSLAIDARIAERGDLVQNPGGRQISKQLEREAAKTRKFLGNEAFEELLHETYEANPSDDAIYVVNPTDPVLATGAGAGIGSLAGVILGSFLGSPTLGSVVGGALGGYYAAPEDRKSRGGWGGGIGGFFTPIGALAGGAIAGRKPSSRRSNPDENPRMTSSREQFIHFLEETLIPDLEESGREGTAEDFERLVEYLRVDDLHWMEGHKQDRQAFIDYLDETLIPDLRESGQKHTADDFRRGVNYLKGDVKTLAAREKEDLAANPKRRTNPAPVSAGDLVRRLKF